MNVMTQAEYLTLQRERDPQQWSQGEWSRIVADHRQNGTRLPENFPAVMPPSWDQSLVTTDDESWDCECDPPHGIRLKGEAPDGGDLLVRRRHFPDENRPWIVIMPITTMAAGLSHR